ncbi:MAG: NFACT family protein [Candidatus Caldarchaeum sp.]|nr:NFACT family protein [Candidatus Caldarchaeum sp.]
MQKMLSSAELGIVVKELKPMVEGAFVKNVYQAEGKTVILKLFKSGFQTFELLLVPGSLITYTTNPFPKPSEPSPNILQLRRLIEGAKVKTISQRGFERIVDIVLENVGLSIVVELLPPGLILLLRDNKVEWVSEAFESAERTVRKGVVYTPPAERFSITPSMEPSQFLDKLNPGSPIVASLSRDLGLGGKYAEETLARAAVEKKVKTSTLTEEHKQRISTALKSIFEEMSNPRPRLYLKGVDGIPSPVELVSLEGTEFVEKTSFCEAVLDAYLLEFEKRKAEEKKRTIEREIQSLEKERSDKLFVAEKLRRRIDDLASITTKLAQNIYVFQDFWENPQQKTEVVASAIGCKAELQNDSLYLQFEESKIVFKRGSSIHRELGKLYDELKTLKKSLDKLLAEADTIGVKIQRLTAEKESVEVKKPPSKPAVAKAVKRPFREFVTSGGFRVMSGRDRRSNVKLLKQHLSGDDIVLHAELPGSPATLLKQGSKAAESDVEEAAQFTACYSRAWREMFSTASVYYVSAEQVSFTPPSGEFLPKGSFMVYGKKKFVSTELRLAVVKKEGALTVVPYLTAERSGGALAELRPGKTRAEEAAFKVFNLLNTSPSREQVESLASQIPYGRCSVYTMNKLINR